MTYDLYIGDRTFRTEVETKSRERLRIAVEEFRRMPPHNPIERCHSLLPIQQQFDDTCCDGAIATMSRRLRFGCPYKQPPDRMTSVH